MFQLRQGRSVLLGMIVGLGVSAIGAVTPKTNLTVRQVTALDKFEPYTDAQTFHDGLLWVGRSRQNADIFYQIEAYLPDGRSAATPVRISHTASYLYPFGDHTILVVGKSATPYWKTHYSIVRYQNGSLHASQYTFPEAIQADRFAGKPGQMYFSEPGSAGIFQIDDEYSPSSARFLPLTIHAPGRMLLADDALFVVEENDIMSLDKQNLVKIDLENQSADHTFKKGLRKALTDMVKLPGRPIIAVTERLADQVLLVHTDTNTVNEKENIHVAGQPWGITLYGNKCIAVLAHTAHAVRFYDVTVPGSPMVADWDLSGPIDRFHRPRVVTADPQSGRLFIRSDDVCPTCQISFNNEVMVEEPGGATFARCQEAIH